MPMLLLSSLGDMYLDELYECMPELGDCYADVIQFCSTKFVPDHQRLQYECVSAVPAM